MRMRYSFGRKGLRDLPRARIVIAGVAAAAVLSLVYLSVRASPGLRSATGLPQDSGTEAGTGVSADAAQNSRRHLGSIIVTPRRGDRCREIGLDNRNGAMWEKGYVDCSAQVMQANPQAEARNLAVERLNAISKALSSGRN